MTTFIARTVEFICICLLSAGAITSFGLLLKAFSYTARIWNTMVL